MGVTGAEGERSDDWWEELPPEIMAAEMYRLGWNARQAEYERVESRDRRLRIVRDDD